MNSRRKFLKTSVFASALVGLGSFAYASHKKQKEPKRQVETFKDGLVISTWDAGLKANEAAWKTLSEGGNALDMAEKGVNETEADFSNLSVGLGGLPDREGYTTLDACIIYHLGCLYYGQQRDGRKCYVSGTHKTSNVCSKTSNGKNSPCTIGG